MNNKFTPPPPPQKKMFKIMHELLEDAEKYDNKGERGICTMILNSLIEYIENDQNPITIKEDE